MHKCQALIKKGTQCNNTATYPADVSVTCKIPAHMQQANDMSKDQKISVSIARPAGSRATSITGYTTESMFTASVKQPIIKSTIKSTVKSTINSPIKSLIKSPIKASTKKYLDKAALDNLSYEEQLHVFLNRKQEIISVLNALFMKGMKSKNDPIEYVKTHFTKDIVRSNLRILEKGLNLLESYQNVLIDLLIKYDVDKEYVALKTNYLRNQSDKTIHLMETLRHLHDNKGGQNLMEV